jgi:mono/diheme cytochrome c family protein/uncharacterized membrane protein
LLVHLPIGILLLALVFYILVSANKKFTMLRPAIPVSLLIGAMAAIMSCISGLILSRSGNYESVLVNRHQWLGIALAVLSIAAFWVSIRKPALLKWLIWPMTILLLITGHLGGSLTHGEGYLTASAPPEKAAAIFNKPIPDVQQAFAYNDLVRPILQARCYQCHGEAKQKGKLRLDEPAFMLQGGEQGNTIVAGSAGESELMKRLLLAMDNKEHMPPKQKTQLTPKEIELLGWWVNAGADFNKQVSQLVQPPAIKPILASLQTGATDKGASPVSDIPETPVTAAPDSVLKKMRSSGVAATSVTRGSNYLSVNFAASNAVSKEQLHLLRLLQPQVLWLKLGNLHISDSAMYVIAGCKNLTRLHLGKTTVTNQQLAMLENLPNLQYLNLFGTSVTVSGLQQLAALKQLKQLYVGGTQVRAAEYELLHGTFAGAMIDTGGYQLEFLATDTMKLKAPVKK